MPEQIGFLSYTRTDDHFFGGYITAFRKSLEQAVHVVTGDREFRLFQDVEGIVTGEQWEGKLTEAIDHASVMVLMLSPMFLSSGPCRSEVEQFIAHEKKLGRDDLILPVYFIPSPKLERAEEWEKDPIAKEILRRQMFDWRENATVRLQEPEAIKALLTLAQAVAAALERLTAEESRRSGPSRKSPRAQRDTRKRISAVGGETKRGRVSTRSVLWIDDTPENDAWERAALKSYGIRLKLARRTREALDLIESESFAAIISDLGRPGEPKAGLNVLESLRTSGNTIPYFIYTSAAAAASLGHVAGAQGVTADADELVAMVVAAAH